MLIFCLTFIDDFEDRKLFENLFNTYRKQMVYLAITKSKEICSASTLMVKPLKIKYWNVQP